MPTATLTSKGQMVIPKPIRDLLGIRPGDRLDFVVSENRHVELRTSANDVRELKGLLHRRGRKPVSLETMKQTVRLRAGR